MHSTVFQWPQVIQGGMGIGVSDWRLARAVASRGQLGVVSGTALDVVFARRLQLGDPGGHMRRALAAFPQPVWAEHVLNAYYCESGIPEDASFRATPMMTWPASAASTELTVVANFCEVYLAKEGHNGPVGINLLQKVQLPTLPCLFGAMLAGVDYVIMGGGIPLAIPGALDALAAGDEATLPLQVEDNPASLDATMTFDPGILEADTTKHPLVRPRFLGIVSSDIIAKTLMRRSTGKIDGFVVEGHTAGGHNAPPRRDRSRTEEGFGPKDVPDIAKIAKLGLPFWLAGGYASPAKVAEAMAAGAKGIQAGTIFAYCDESAISACIKKAVLCQTLDGGIDVDTGFRASPTGYPFKLVRWSDDNARALAARRRTCDVGLLRDVCLDDQGRVSYRCPAEPEFAYVAKGGQPADTEGRLCLCNGLLGTIGLGQRRAGGQEPAILTSGEDFAFVAHLASSQDLTYSASDVLAYLLEGQNQ